MKENKFAILLRSRKYQEAVAQRCSVKKVFLEISENSQENTCARVSGVSSCRHTRKAGPGTLRWDPGPRTLKWDPRVGH